MRLRRAILALVAVAANAACGAAPGAGPSGPARPPIVLPETVITKTAPEELDAKFQRASATLLREEFQLAADEFDAIVAVSPEGPTAAPSLYNAGMAYAGMGDLSRAAERFRASAERDPAGPTAKTAWIRVSRMMAYLERWEDLEVAAARLAERPDLTVLENLEAQGAKALSLVERGRVDEAFTIIVKARDEIEDKRLGQAGTPPLELAQIAFTLGEIRKQKSERIVFDPMPADFGAALEERCTGLLDAQSAFSDAMRSRDAHWSGMAGFRVGQLYQNLHRDVMRVPAPTRTTTLRERQLWEGAMRLRYRVLLEKGLKMMQGTVDLGERTGEEAAWVSRAKQAKLEIEAALGAERDALAKLPFTEEELRKALADLQKKPAPKP
jgi:tetratricopeptide (TPR) repeat protein